MPASLLPDRTRVSRVQLRIRNLPKALVFYRDALGLRVLEQRGSTTSLSADETGSAWLVLTEEASAAPASARFTGLFHVAIRYPTKPDLARALLRLAQHNYPIQGASDHLVSEALYLSDPDGNGIELYADRPRTQWAWRNGQVTMTTEALDIDNLLSTIDDSTRPALAPAGTDIGHIHLCVADLSHAEEFYHGFLGLAVTQRSYPGALFFAAGGYHHHIAANTWGGKTRPPDNTAGLISYRLEVPTRETVVDIQQRAVRAGYETQTHVQDGAGQELLQVRDLNGNWLEIVSAV